MIEFRRRTMWERLVRLIPAVRRRQDAELRAAIDTLLADPSLPCKIEGHLIPNGYGSGDAATL